jgi:SRSO17 transposase
MIDEVVGWEEELNRLHARVGGRFGRVEPRRRALGYLRGLLSPVERKNGWQLAEWLGDARPDGVQRLLTGSGWDADGVREDLRSYVVEHLGDPDAVLVVDETGFLKKGTGSVGVKRQYSGTAGRVENCQVGVFLCYATENGAAFLDRSLYLPKEWVADVERLRKASVPEEVTFATKPRLAQEMLRRALDAAVPCRWVTGDSVYGSHRSLRLWLEQRRQAFVLGVKSDESLCWQGFTPMEAREIVASLAPERWVPLSAGDGAKGPRLYDWAWEPLWRIQVTEEERKWSHWLLVRRDIENPEEFAYYVVFAPRETTLDQVVHVAGMRWRIEVGFEEAKGCCGLDEYECRKWEAWHRHITLSLLAHAFLSVVRAHEEKGGLPSATTN